MQASPLASLKNHEEVKYFALLTSKFHPLNNSSTDQSVCDCKHTDTKLQFHIHLQQHGLFWNPQVCNSRPSRWSDLNIPPKLKIKFGKMLLQTRKMLPAQWAHEAKPWGTLWCFPYHRSQEKKKKKNEEENSFHYLGHIFPKSKLPLLSCFSYYRQANNALNSVLAIAIHNHDSEMPLLQHTVRVATPWIKLKYQTATDRPASMS